MNSVNGCGIFNIEDEINTFILYELGEEKLAAEEKTKWPHWR